MASAVNQEAVDIQRDVLDALPVTAELSRHVVSDPREQEHWLLFVFIALLVMPFFVSFVSGLGLSSGVARAVTGIVLAALLVALGGIIVSLRVCKKKHQRTLARRKELEVQATSEIAALEARHPQALVAAAKPYGDFLIQLNPSLVADLADYRMFTSRPLYYFRQATAIAHETAAYRRVAKAKKVLAG